MAQPPNDRTPGILKSGRYKFGPAASPRIIEATGAEIPHYDRPLHRHFAHTYIADYLRWRHACVTQAQKRVGASQHLQFTHAAALLGIPGSGVFASRMAVRRQ